ncbi:MAG: short-chain fatty acid transporter, partial [Bdellovibrionales bacterium]|nr:TIGR00366 family protein [Bdellovibrionales bacterium]NQZ20352.1 short-chain fatty acid transporter [Bdellovibrionales bacterium]
MKKVIHFCDSLMQRFLPDPFVIAVVLTYVVFILAFMTTSHSAIDLSLYWGEGLWSLLKFMTQMCLVLLGGYIVASAYPVKKFLVRLAKIPRSSAEVVFATFIISTLACWLNWGLGLVVSAFVALEMARYHKNVSFRLLVATSYMGFIFWHGGLSGSIPLVVNTPDNFSAQWIGGLIPIGDTVFSNLNFIIIFGLISLLGLLVVFLDQKSDDDTVVVIDPLMEEKTEVIDMSVSQKMDQSRIVNWVVVAMGAFYLYAAVIRDQFLFDLNMVNLLLILFGLLLHSNTKEFL